MQETEPVPETNEPEVDVVEPISVPDEKPMQELTEEEREKLMKRKAEKELEYTATMQKWGKVALYAMFFPTFLSIITIIAGVW
jgi:membrane protein YqaA with SNARE-associated domain